MEPQRWNSVDLDKGIGGDISGGSEVFSLMFIVTMTSYLALVTVIVLCLGKYDRPVSGML